MEITEQEIKTLADTWYEAQAEALQKALDAAAAPFLGRVSSKSSGLAARKQAPSASTRSM